MAHVDVRGARPVLVIGLRAVTIESGWHGMAVEHATEILEMLEHKASQVHHQMPDSMLQGFIKVYTELVEYWTNAHRMVSSAQTRDYIDAQAKHCESKLATFKVLALARSARV